MKKIGIISIIALGTLSVFGFALKPTAVTKKNSPVANVKVGAEKSGFTETTSW